MPRDDYKELMELCLLILGESHTDQSIYRFRLPGAYHMARWMAKVIYCFKIYLLRNQFHLTSSEHKHLTEFCLFVSHVYVKSWITSPVTCDAPVNDLHLFKNIKRYSTVNKLVSAAAMRKFENHLWYIGPELASLSLFSNSVSMHMKCNIVDHMCQTYDPEVQWNVRTLKADKSRDLSTAQLSDLVNSSSVPALHSLGVDMDFILSSDPHTWSTSAVFQQAQSIACSLTVVNDAAERSIALMSNFNQSITKNEAEMQTLLQVVADHRQRLPDTRKSTLKAASAQSD